MRRSYTWLVAAVLAAALILSGLGHRIRPRTAVAPMPARTPASEVALEIRAGRVEPAVVAVAKGREVRLSVVNRGTQPVHLALAGYEDRFEIPVLHPQQSWRGKFLADRPGEDFAWLLDGRPAGRFVVTGSHLVDGHR